MRNLVSLCRDLILWTEAKRWRVFSPILSRIAPVIAVLGHFVGRFRQKLNLQFIARPVQLSAFERAIIWQIYRATLSSVGYYTSRTRHVSSNEDKCSIVPTEINYLRLLRERNKKKNLFRSLSVARSEKRILILLLHISLLLEMVTNIRPENSPFI